FIPDLDTADELTGIARVADMNNLRLRSESSQVTAGIDDCACHAEVGQHRERAIDRKALCDATEIDDDIRAVEAHGMPGQELDRLAAASAGASHDFPDPRQ